MADDHEATLPNVADIDRLGPALAAAAQRIYDAWSQDDEGHDEEVGAGGICDAVADAMLGVMTDAYPEIIAFTNYVEATTHVEIISSLAEGVHRIDIPAGVYEIGFGYVWSKRPGVTITASDITIDLLDANPERYGYFMDGDAR